MVDNRFEAKIDHVRWNISILRSHEVFHSFFLTQNWIYYTKMVLKWGRWWLQSIKLYRLCSVSATEPEKLCCPSSFKYHLGLKILDVKWATRQGFSNHICRRKWCKFCFTGPEKQPRSFLFIDCNIAIKLTDPVTFLLTYFTSVTWTTTI